MPTEWVNFLNAGVCLIKHLKLDVAVPGAQVQLIRTFEGHGNRKYEQSGPDSEIFSMRLSRPLQPGPISRTSFDLDLLFFRHLTKRRPAG